MRVLRVSIFVGGCRIADALRVDRKHYEIPMEGMEFETAWEGFADAPHVLCQELLRHLDTAGLTNSDWSQVTPAKQPVPTPPHAGAVTVALKHLPVSTSSQLLVAWVHAIGDEGAVFADVRPSFEESGACRDLGYLTFSSHTAASRFLRRAGRSRRFGECFCEVSWASPVLQGLRSQVRQAVLRRKTAPIVRSSEGKWALVEKMPFVEPTSTMLGEAFRRDSKAVDQHDLTTVMVHRLPKEYVNAHLLAWFNRLGEIGSHANFARLIPGPNETKAVVNFDSHADALSFYRQVSSMDISPCVAHDVAQSPQSVTWAPRDSQGLEAQLGRIKTWFEKTTFRDVSGTWHKIRVSPFNDAATGVRMMGGAYVRVTRPRGCYQ